MKSGIQASSKKGGDIMFTNYNEILKLDEVAEILNLSLPTVYKLTNSGRIPYFADGRKRLIYKEELIHFVIRS